MLSRERAIRAVVGQIVGGIRADAVVVDVQQEATLLATSARLAELDVRLSDGTALQLMLKEGGRAGRLPDAPVATPPFVRNALREIWVYERLLVGRGLDTPRLYGSLVEPQRGRYWMFLERVPGMQLRWAVERGEWRRTAQWLARAHAALSQAGANQPYLLVHDARYYRRWLRRARALTPRADRRRRARLAWLARHYDGLVERLVSLPRTVIHGELYPSNVLVDESTAEGRICVLDWEMTAVGPAVIDLAALTGGRLTPSEREAIVASYRAALPADASALRGSTSAEALDCARLHFAVQWMGWARGWAAPAEQQHDWLSEAVEIGESMGWGAA